MKDEKQSGCRSVSLRLGFALLLQFLLMRLIGWRGNEFYYFFTGEIADEVVAEIIDCFIYLFSFMVPVGLFRLISIGRRTEPMHLEVRLTGNGLLWIVIGLGFIPALAYWGDFFFSQMDFSGIYASETISSESMTVASFLSTAVVPAVAEEFLFRGCVLSNLLPYGKEQAVFASAFLFAMMHSNPLQFFYAFCAGLILGAVFAETGSVWPGMFLHLFNNFSSVIQTVVMEHTDAYLFSVLYYLAQSLTVIAGIICFILLLQRKKGKLLSAEETPAEQGKKGVSGLFSVSIIIYVALCALRAIYILYIALFYV